MNLREEIAATCQGPHVLENGKLYSCEACEARVKAFKKWALEMVGEDGHPLIEGGFQHDDHGEPVAGTLNFDSTQFHSEIAGNMVRNEIRQRIEESTMEGGVTK